MPIYGIQLPFVLALCLPLRLDSALAYLAAHVSNPLTLPFLLLLEMDLGSLVLTGRQVVPSLAEMKRLGFAVVGAQLVVGSLVLGVGLAVIGATATWFAFRRMEDARTKELTAARERTVARYAGAPRPARAYVAIKLRTDPSLAAIVALEGPFGRVVDAGSGFGQIGLCLLELGRASAVVGIDDDANRIAVAEGAARGSARFVRQALPAAEFPQADTVLFIDSLHYLPLSDQDTVLGRAAEALAAGGRIVVREVHAQASWRSRLTERMERRAARKAARPEPAFRTAASIVLTLERLGLTCTVPAGEAFGIVHNVLIVGVKMRPEAPAA
jgi:SAM-dependent methyltransferase